MCDICPLLDEQVVDADGFESPIVAGACDAEIHSALREAPRAILGDVTPARRCADGGVRAPRREAGQYDAA